MSTSTHPRRLGGDEGAVLVEAALVMPLLFLMILGMVEYSVAELQSSQASSAARDGARVGILDYANADVNGSAAHQKIVDAVNARLDGQPDVTVAVSCLEQDGATIACNTAVADQDRIQVRVSWPYQKVTGAIPVVPTTISSTSRMKLAGLVMSPTVTTSTTSTSSTSTTSTSSTSTTSTTSTTTPSGGCTVAGVDVDDGSKTGTLPRVNTSSHKLTNSLNVRVRTNGSTNCLPVVVTVYPAGGGAASGTPLVASGVAGSGGVYTTIFDKNETWAVGDVLVHVSWGGSGSQDVVVNLQAK